MVANFPHAVSMHETRPLVLASGVVENAYLGATVACPVLGEIPREDCAAHQRRPFAATNPVALHRGAQIEWEEPA